MKFLFIICFLFFTLLVVAQKNDSIQIKNIRFEQSYTIPANFFLNPDALDKEYKPAQTFKGIKTFHPIKIFTASSTIFDETKMILLDSFRFFAYHISCMQQFCTSGFYKKENLIYTLSSNKEVESFIQGMIDEYYTKLQFVNFSKKVFKEVNNTLVFIE